MLSTNLSQVVSHRKITSLAQSQQENREITQLLKEIIKAGDIGILVLNTDHQVIIWSEWLIRLSGFTEEQVAGQRIDQLFPDLADSRLLFSIEDALKKGMPAVLSQKFHPHDLPLFANQADRYAGKRISQMITIKPLELDQRYCLLQIIDVSSAVMRDKMLRDLAHAHKKRELKTRAMLSSIAEAVLATDNAGCIEFSNLAAEKLTGFKSSDMLGKPLGQVFKIFMDDNDFEPSAKSARFLKKNEIMYNKQGNQFLVRNDGSYLPIEKSIADVCNELGETQGMVLIFRDVSDSRKMAAQLSWQASHDALTGLCNRTEFSRHMEYLLQAPVCEKGHCLLYLDLDRFKIVNDTCGHIAGDKLLRQVGLTIRKAIRNNDVLARLGGDEFGLSLGNCSLDTGKKIAENIHQNVQKLRFNWKNKQFTIGVSIGLVHIDQNNVSVEHILSLADAACYAAKDGGRNQIHVYRPDESAAATRHSEIQWVTRIRNALDTNGFTLFAQPIQPIQSEEEKIQYHEILIRMLDEDGTVIPPGTFIPAAERYGLMPLIDRWVVKTTFELIFKHNNQFTGQNNRFFINLSGDTLNDNETLMLIQQLLAQYNVPANLFCFEVTETSAISNLTSAEQFIRMLQSHGCLFALDDFGSGLSSFRYLKHLPVNYLKIDGSFVKGIVHDSIDRSMVEAINNIGHFMGLKTIAEFVEDNDTLYELQKIGVNFAQGFALSRPFPVAQLIS